MTRMPVLCPETRNVEHVELQRTAYGVVIESCTRFQSKACNLQCGRMCASRIDAIDRLEIDDREERVLVLYADVADMQPHAEVLGAALARDGFIVELAALGDAAPSPADYEAVVIGMQSRLGLLPRDVGRYLASHREALATIPTFMFSLGGDATTDADAIAARTGWLPLQAVALARPSRFAWCRADRDSVVAENRVLLESFALSIADAIPAIAQPPY
jgi:hypothetical protein